MPQIFTGRVRLMAVETYSLYSELVLIGGSYSIIWLLLLAGNIWDTFYTKSGYKLCLSVEVCFMVEKDPFGVCNDCYTSPAFG